MCFSFFLKVSTVHGVCFQILDFRTVQEFPQNEFGLRNHKDF